MNRTTIILTILIMNSTSCQSQDPETVKYVDLEKYSGLWYEIAAFPTRFEKGCSNTTAEYQISESGHVIVINRCKRDEKRTKIKGKAFIVPNSGNAKLKVQFFWPFRGDYWIFELADDYSVAVVGSPSRKYLWILARENKLDENIYREFVLRMEQKGFDTGQLVRTEHNK